MPQKPSTPKPARLQCSEFGQHDRSHHVDEQRHRRDPGQQAEEDQCAADNLDHPVQIGEERGGGDADPLEAARTQLIWIHEFLDSLTEKHQPHQQPYTNDGRGALGVQ